MTFANDARIYAHIVELHETMVNEWKAESSDPDFITQCMFQSIPTIFAQHSIEKGGNMLGLDDVKENVVMLLLNIAVKRADLEDPARKKLRSFGEQIQKYAASLDGLIDWRYLNYADYYQVCENSIVPLPLADNFSEPSWKLRPEEFSQDP
jgi:Cu2+-containing amine oxidase